MVLNTLAKTALPSLRRTVKFKLGMEAGNVVRQPLHHVARRHVVSGIDGAGETGRVGSAVAFDDDAVKPKEDTAIQLARIHLLFEGAECALRQEGTDASKER